MLLQPIIILCVLGVAFALFMFALSVHKKREAQPALRAKKQSWIKNLLTTDVKDVDVSEITTKINDNKTIQNLGSKINNATDLERLFRKAKNPWNLTPASFNFIRFGGLIFGLVLGLIFIPIAYVISIIAFLFAVLCYFVPKQKYESIAKNREAQWNQLYQFIWVIQHNLTYYDAKKTWLQTSSYIEEHSDSLQELVQGFRDFGDTWTGREIPEQIQYDYGEFDIPSQLYSIVLNAQETGEYPENELNGLRQIIVQRMDFTIKEALALVETKATLISSPFLIITLLLVVLVPVGLNLLETLS